MTSNNGPGRVQGTLRFTGGALTPRPPGHPSREVSKSWKPAEACTCNHCHLNTARGTFKVNIIKAPPRCMTLADSDKATFSVGENHKKSCSVCYMLQ